MARVGLTIAAVISAIIHLWGEYQGPPILIYIFKPLTMVFIIAIALRSRRPNRRVYKVAVLAGLVFSLGGDIFLMLPVDLFIAGLISFLIAHVIYIYAFQAGRPFRLNLLSVLPLILYGAVIYGILFPGLGGMVIPVAFYVVIILIMAWRAWDQWDQVRTRWAILALVGAVLFVISDSILALNRFGEPFIAARALTLSTYYAAQWLIANSING